MIAKAHTCQKLDAISRELCYIGADKLSGDHPLRLAERRTVDFREGPGGRLAAPKAEGRGFDPHRPLQ